jgi:Raf kinase inhibitor-like YbhB/YbcL family protein
MRPIILMCSVLLVITGACSSGEETSSQTASSSTTTDQTSTTQPAATPEAAMQLTSAAFGQGDAIPVRFTCDGNDISPALTITDIPTDAVSLVLIMEDPDAPGGTWDHWIAYDIPVVTEIAENVGALGTAGTNSWGESGYGGPCPPSGTHRYLFTISAVDSDLGIQIGATKTQVLAALDGRVLAAATLMGTYSR